MTDFESIRGLRQGELMLWVVERAAVLADLHRDPQCAAQDEREAKRRPPVLQARFLAGRHCLRRALGLLLERDPREIRIGLLDHGKPWVPGAPHFNLSHAQGHLILAVCQDQAVGVDIEDLESRSVDKGVARACLSEDELAVLEAAEFQGHGQAAFLRSWTRLEARAKLHGRGLGTLLPQSDVVRALGPAWVEDLALLDPLVGAVALRKAPTHIRLFQPEGRTPDAAMAVLAAGTSNGGAR